MKIATLLCGTLALAALVGCEAQSHPIAAGAEPAFAARPSMERTIFEERVLLDHPCAGELIDLELTTELIVFSHVDGRGGLNQWVRISAAGSGVGEQSGTTYHFKANASEQEQVRLGPQGELQQRTILQVNTLLRAPRLPSATAHLTFLLSTDARGQLRAEVDRISLRCPSGEVLETGAQS
jgi:hypothetical protein